jgi:hypothetical protein
VFAFISDNVHSCLFITKRGLWPHCGAKQALQTCARPKISGKTFSRFVFILFYVARLFYLTYLLFEQPLDMELGAAPSSDQEKSEAKTFSQWQDQLTGQVGFSC